MKELSIEEKAKRYDEAMKYAMIYYKNGNKDMKTMMKTCFPVLVEESEDERIRKAIIEHFEGSHSSMYPYKGFTKEQILAWLEKQGEQKTEVKYVYTKFQIGDTIVEIKPNGYCQPVRVKYIGDGAYSCESDDGKRSLSFPIINQDDYELVEQKPAVWSDEDEEMLKSIKYHLDCDNADIRCYGWLEELKERVQPQPKQEWSEEDEEAINIGRLACLRFEEEAVPTGFSISFSEASERLKSLRPQSH